MIIDATSIKALTFDVFGTVVDWRTAIVRAGGRLGRAKGFKVDWEAFAEAWRGGYQPAMDRVRRGELPWTNFDRLQRLMLDQTLERFGITALTEAEKEDLAAVWTRLKGWPDSARGLRRLRRRFIVAALSNGNLGMLTRVSKFARLTWDCILSAEFVRHYKPDREVYESAMQYFGLQPHEVMMVAAHKYDLKAAKEVGMRTAFIKRPLEYGPSLKPDFRPEPYIDVMAKDIEDLARRLATDR